MNRVQVLLVMTSVFSLTLPAVTHAGVRRAPMALHAEASGSGRGFAPASPAGLESVPDGTGGFYIAWSDSRDGENDIFLLRLAATGDPAPGWPTTGLGVCTAPGDQRLVGVLPDGANGVVVAWTDTRSAEISGDVYAQRVSSAGIPAWTPDGALVAARPRRFSSPFVAADGSGGLVCMWRVGNAETDVFASRVDGAGNVPAGWAVDGNSVCEAPGSQEPSAIVGDGAGGAYVFWSDSRPGAPGAYAQHLTAAGAPGWTVDGVLIDGGRVGEYPVACSDGSGGALVVWGDSGALRGQRLDATGAEHWTAGGVLFVASGPSYGWTLEPAPAGGAFLAWTDGVTDWSVRVQLLTAAGARAWDTTAVLVAQTGSAYTYGQSAVTDGQGGAIVTWLDGRNAVDGASSIWAQRLDAVGAPQWAANGVLVAGAPGLPSVPEVVGDGGGGARMAWYDFRSIGAIVVQHLDGAGGALFAAGGRIVFDDEASQYGGRPVADGAGGTWLVWEAVSGLQTDVFARHLAANGQPAGATVTVCDAPGSQSVEKVTGDGSGGVIVAWADARPGGSGRDFYVQRVTSAGTPAWTANGLRIAGGAQSVFTLAVDADGTGGAYAGWSNYSFDVRLQHVDAAGTLAWGAGGIAVCNDAATQYWIQVRQDGAGGVIAAWADGRDANDFGVFAQRLSGAGAPLWTANGVRVASYGHRQGIPIDLVSDGSNGAVIISYSSTYDLLTTSSLDTLRAQRIDAGGVPQWVSPGTVVASPGAQIDDIAVSADGAGGVVVAWSDERTALARVWAQRVNASGSAQWTAGGAAIGNSAASQALTGIAPDGSGGAIVAWSEDSAGDRDLFAQRIAGNGSLPWGAGGIAVVGAAGGQYRGGLAADGAGGAFVGWTDNRAGTVRHVFAQRVGAGGTVAWGADGATSTLASLLAATLDARGARLEWRLADAVPVTLERATSGGAWEVLAELVPDADHRVRFTDEMLDPGVSRGYRLRAANGAVLGDAVWLAPVDAPSFALGVAGVNPTRGAFRLAFSLADARGARLELFDVAGRRLEQRALDALGSGRHTLDVGQDADGAGVYFARLTQGDRTARLRLVRVD